MAKQLFDVDAWVRARFSVYNLEGGKGYDRGVRKIDCPFCLNADGSAWVNVRSGTIKCFHASCPAHGRGVDIIEAVRQYDGFTTRTEAMLSLRQEFPPLDIEYEVQPERYQDWCRLPPEMSLFSEGFALNSICADRAYRFASKQWGVSQETLVQFDCGYCWTGLRFDKRIIVPIRMNGRLVGFQGRTFVGAEPRYKMSKYGDQREKYADCGRPAEAMLFNYDTIAAGGPVLIVEGVGDVMSWEQRRKATGSSLIATAGLGNSFGLEKACLLMAKQPSLIVVALDVGAEQARDDIVTMFQLWGATVFVGSWSGGKDPGEGAELSYEEAGDRVSRIRRIRKHGRTNA